MIITENGRKLMLDMVKESGGGEAVLFETEEIDGGLSLGMHIIDLQEGDRIVEYGELKVVISEELEDMLGDVIFDEQNGELVVCEEEGEYGYGEESDGCSCGGSCGGHDDGECGCGGHDGGCCCS